MIFILFKFEYLYCETPHWVLMWSSHNSMYYKSYFWSFYFWLHSFLSNNSTNNNKSIYSNNLRIHCTHSRFPQEPKYYSCTTKQHCHYNHCGYLLLSFLHPQWHSQNVSKNLNEIKCVRMICFLLLLWQMVYRAEPR